MVDREQVRRDARFHADHSASTPVTKSLARDCLALLAELEQAERERDEQKEAADELTERWLGMRDCYDREVLRAGKAEAQLEKVPALVEALRHARRELWWFIEECDDDGEFVGDLYEVAQRALMIQDDVLAPALAAYEQAQG